MGKTLAAVMLAACTAADAAAPGAHGIPDNSIELIRDGRFRNGFKIAAPTPGRKEATGLIKPRSVAGQSAWVLCQWNSKYDLSGAAREDLDGQTVRYANQAKAVIVSAGNTYNDLVLALDSRPEFSGTVRRPNQPWPHLLVEQDDVPLHLFRDVDKIAFSLQALLLKNEQTLLAGHDRGLHSAQFLLTFIVQDRNPNSPGCGDLIWFNVPMYNEHDKFCALYAARDTADPSAKFIFAPASTNFSGQTLHDGQWATFAQANLLPLFHQAFNRARAEGYLKNSPDFGDFAITSVIIGWEVTGINNVSMRIKNLDVRVHPSQQGKAVAPAGRRPAASLPLRAKDCVQPEAMARNRSGQP